MQTVVFQHNGIFTGSNTHPLILSSSHGTPARQEGNKYTVLSVFGKEITLNSDELHYYSLEGFSRQS